MPQLKHWRDVRSRSLLITEQLKNALARQDTMEAAVALACCFDTDYRSEEIWQKLDKMSLQVKTKATARDQSAAFIQLLDCFYRDLAFSCHADSPNLWRHSLLSHVVDYRIGMPVSLAIVLAYLAKQIGIVCEGMIIPGHFILVCHVKESRHYVDPRDGSVLSEAELQRYCKEFDEDIDVQEYLEVRASSLDTVTRLLQNLRHTCMRDGRLQDSLLASELLVNLHPDDPYEYRSRGIVLERLMLPQQALSDYQHFIRECPQDPSSHLLKLQLRQRHRHQRTVLH